MSAVSQEIDAPQAPLASVTQWLNLLKPRVMSLVVFTGGCGMVLAPNALQTHPFVLLLIVLCIALGSGAGGMINMWYDRDIDGVMKRTQRRALPLGLIAADDVLMIGVMLSVISVMLLGLATNWVAAGWLAFAIFFYSVIYTMWLKRHTPQNIVIGGAAGAFPPVIGWAAIAGGTPLEAWLMFAIIFFWTPPHFWALALNCNEDYRRASIPMLPVTHGAAHTVRSMLHYSLALALISVTPAFIGAASWLYAAAASIFSGLFVWRCIQVYQQPTALEPAKRLFRFSILYLFAIFAFLVIDASLL
jgi:heme o synthase